MKRNILISGLVALVISLLTVVLYQNFGGGKTVRIEHVDGNPAQQTVFTVDEDGEVVALDFSAVAAEVMDAVVNIQSTQTSRMAGDRMPPNMPDILEEFFGPRFSPPSGEPRPRVGTGSGVIISEDGYIVTNNHVVANAEDIDVTLYDNRSFKATVIGTDPSTDLALIKIEAADLPTLAFQDSETVKVGEWVLAVGNPFNLTSTITAGIVSAKARNINILREQFAVESFIQTDAAINPGNSGGALVNLRGGLIGINTAIASPTGAYSGYGFAVPSNIVQKVVEDLLEYGTVQRGVLGVMIRNVDGSLAREKGLEVSQGAYVDSLLANSAAGEAGIRPGDVIVAVDGKAVRNTSKLQELIAQRRPGDEVRITVSRDGREQTIPVTLNNANGRRRLIASAAERTLRNLLGADLRNLPADEARELGLKGGVEVTQLYPGRLRQYTGIEAGFIITRVDGKAVAGIDELQARLEQKKGGGVMLEGIYPNNPEKTLYFGFGL